MVNILCYRDRKKREKKEKVSVPARKRNKSFGGMLSLLSFYFLSFRNKDVRTMYACMYVCRFIERPRRRSDLLMKSIGTSGREGVVRATTITIQCCNEIGSEKACGRVCPLGSIKYFYRLPLAIKNGGQKKRNRGRDVSES